MTPTISAANNPFRSALVTALPFLPQNGPWEELLQQLEKMNWRGAVVGPCGTGKTTLLEKLEVELAERGFEVLFLRLSSFQQSLPTEFWNQKFTCQNAVLLDGAEQLSPWKWRRVRNHFRNAGALVMTSHRAGRLQTWLETSTSPNLLAQLCAELGKPQPIAVIERIFHDHRGNLRLCLMEFYDLAGKTP